MLPGSARYHAEVRSAREGWILRQRGSLGRSHEEIRMAEPTKEYGASIRVKLTDEFLPTPVLSKAEVEALLKEALRVGAADSPIVSISVHDRRR